MISELHTTKSKVNIWKVNETDTVFVNDEIEIIESMGNKAGSKGYKYTVTSVKKFKEIDSSCNRTIHRLYLQRSDGETRMLLIDSAFSETFVTLYKLVDILPDDCNRKELIEKAIFYLFKEPSDPENFIPSDLEYSEKIYFPNDEELEWDARESVYANQLDTDAFTQFYFYHSNPELNPGVILELGGVDKNTGDKNPDGGLVKVYQGRDIDFDNIEIFCD